MLLFTRRFKNDCTCNYVNTRQIDIPISEYENFVSHDNLYWFDREKYALVKQDILLPKTATVADIITAVLTKQGLDPNSSTKKYR